MQGQARAKAIMAGPTGGRRSPKERKKVQTGRADRSHSREASSLLRTSRSARAAEKKKRSAHYLPAGGLRQMHPHLGYGVDRPPTACIELT